MQEQVPAVIVDQLQVTKPTDDDLCWFNLPDAKATIHLEGMGFPFPIETLENDCSDALKANSAGEAVDIITCYLQAVQEDRPCYFDVPFYRHRGKG